MIQSSARNSIPGIHGGSNFASQLSQSVYSRMNVINVLFLAYFVAAVATVYFWGELKARNSV